MRLRLPDWTNLLALLCRVFGVLEIPSIYGLVQVAPDQQIAASPPCLSQACRPIEHAVSQRSGLRVPWHRSRVNDMPGPDLLVIENACGLQQQQQQQHQQRRLSEAPAWPLLDSPWMWGPMKRPRCSTACLLGRVLQRLWCWALPCAWPQVGCLGCCMQQ